MNTKPKPCKAKAMYVSEDAAKAALANARKRTNDNLHYYYCSECDAYHIGHRKGRK